MDMSPSIGKACFPSAIAVTDRFHLVRLALDAMQHVRIDQRWKEIDKENQKIQQARSRGSKYQPIILFNGDTSIQLLVRSRYLLYKHSKQWTPTQIHRAGLLFQLYPVIERAYRLAWNFRTIYENTSKDELTLARQSDIDHFETVANALFNH